MTRRSAAAGASARAPAAGAAATASGCHRRGEHQRAHESDQSISHEISHVLFTWAPFYHGQTGFVSLNLALRRMGRNRRESPGLDLDGLPRAWISPPVAPVIPNRENTEAAEKRRNSLDRALSGVGAPVVCRGGYLAHPPRSPLITPPSGSQHADRRAQV